MDEVFEGLDGIGVIYDNILVYGCGNIDEEIIVVSWLYWWIGVKKEILS